MKVKPEELSVKIKNFLDEYAGVIPDFDPEYDDECDKFTSPDAGILFAASEMLAKDLKIQPSFIVFSEWGSGGFKPYNSKAGRLLHDEIVEDCEKIKKVLVNKQRVNKPR
jgi:hypothetical protein